MSPSSKENADTAMSDLKRFCQIVRSRSSENKKATLALVRDNLFGNAMSVLRQELDSMVRIIYLLSCTEEKRHALIKETLNGNRWNVTDKTMVGVSDKCHGWTKSVYKFGCAFIHLSQFHNYLSDDPFSKIETAEANDIKQHLNHYHGFPLENDISIRNLQPYLIPIFDKISGNLNCYIEDLESGGSEDFNG